MLTWFNAIWNSIEKLSSVVTLANWGIAATLLITFVFTAIVIIAGNRGDALLQASDLEKEERISSANRLAGEANERAGKLEKEAAELTANNLQLEATISPRKLSERQQRLLAALGAFAGKDVEDGALTNTSSVSARRDGISTSVGFGVISRSRPAAAVISVGAKPTN